MSKQCNPFSTQFVRPGVMPWADVEGIDVENLVQTFRENRFEAQIVGPHGSGKTTLANEVASRMGETFELIQFITIRRNERRLEVTARKRGTGSSSDRTLLVVDGAEKLSPIQRWMLKRFCQRRKFGILTTSHFPSRWLKQLVQTKPELGAFRKVCGWLQRDCDEKIGQGVVDDSFHRHSGDFREAFMNLYDSYERISERESSVHTHQKATVE